MRKIILASGSANRKTVMDALHVLYSIIPADIDEKAIRDENVAIQAQKIARAKAEVVAIENPDAIILAGDSFAVNNGNVFEKPSSLDEAKTMLQQQSGGNGIFYAGFCYLDKENTIDYSTTVEVPFSLRELNEAEIDTYIAAFPVLTWSGAIFPGNVYGASMIKEIHGSLSTFIYGFPSELIISCLQKSGIKVHP